MENVPVKVDEAFWVLRMTSDESDLLDNLLEYVFDKVNLDHLLEYSNAYRKELFGEDWEPSDHWSKERFEAVLESLCKKHCEAGLGRGRDNHPN